MSVIGRARCPENPTKCLRRVSPTVGPTSSVRLHIYICTYITEILLSVTLGDDHLILRGGGAGTF